MCDTSIADEKFRLKPTTGGNLEDKHDDKHQHSERGTNDKKEGHDLPVTAGHGNKDEGYRERGKDGERDALQYKIRVGDQRDLSLPGKEFPGFITHSLQDYGR